jgi:murein L,D-transpeptidase YafK
MVISWCRAALRSAIEHKKSSSRYRERWPCGAGWVLCLSIAITGCFSGPDPEAPAARSTTPKLINDERSDPWIVIDSESDRLTIYRKNLPAIEFKNIAFGAAGVREKVRSGDDITPRGNYTIGWVKYPSKFSIFIGLTYPSIADAERGYRRGVINVATFERIRGAHAQGRVPPQDTPLGGFIGIHGVGKGSIEIHRLANWTAGCIAVENEQIELLSRLVKPGTQVEIR